MEHLSIGFIFKGIKKKENGSFSCMNDELNYMNYNTKYFIFTINYTCFCDMHEFKFNFKKWSLLGLLLNVTNEKLSYELF